MIDVEKMVENLNTAVVACDADFKIIYANRKCKQMFKAYKMEGFVGNQMGDYHKSETMEKLRTLFADYAERKKNMDYYTTETPNGKLTIVNTPSYDGEIFAGVVEFFFEGSLA
jgi:PAS domain S-box-containing protein